MDACEPRVRRRGFFLHSTDGNSTKLSTKTSKACRFASASPLPDARQFLQQQTDPDRISHRRRPDQIRGVTGSQINGHTCPADPLARGSTRNATTAPTSSGRPNHQTAAPVRRKMCNFVRILTGGPATPEQTDPGATVPRMLSLASYSAPSLFRLISAALTEL